MKKLVFAVRDIKISCFNVPFIADNEITAIRSLTQAMMQSETLLTSFPADFELFQLAEYDDIQGKYKNLDMPKFIISAATIQLNMLKSQQFKAKHNSESAKEENNALPKQTDNSGTTKAN